MSKPPGLAFHTDAAGTLGLVATLRERLPQLLDDYHRRQDQQRDGSSSSSGSSSGGAGETGTTPSEDGGPFAVLIPPGAADGSSGISDGSSGSSAPAARYCPERLWPVHRLDTMTSGWVAGR